MVRVHRYFIAFALATSFAAIPAASFAGVFLGIGIGGGGIGITVGIAPPPLPVYDQPPCLVADTIWTPGYWAYGPYGYYWVPGTWVEAPEVGYLWTPGYWGYGDGGYAWHGGYWGRHVGFYGGVNYGFGYGGDGYDGGGWHGDHFRYNTAYTNVNRTTIDNVYVNRTVINNYDRTVGDRTSYNGGEYGLRSRPNADQIAYRDERHLPVTPVQRQHIDTAAQNRNFLDSVNHGRPNDAAVAMPLGRENRPAGFTPTTATDRRTTAVGANAAARDNAEGRTTTDPFSRFDRNSPSYARTNAQASETSRLDREKSATADPYSRFARNSPSYARSNAQASETSRLDREKSATADPYSRFDRNARSYARSSAAASESSRYDRENAMTDPYEGVGRNATSHTERSYGAERTVNAYHPQPATRSERTYGATASRDRPEATYRSHAAPQAEHSSERSHPVEHSEPHHDESSHSHEH